MADGLEAAQALSTDHDSPQALRAAWEEARASLAGDPDLVVVFCSSHHAAAAEDLADELARLAPEAAVMGAVASDGVISGEREVERGPGLALWIARLGRGEAVTFHASSSDPSAEDAEVVGVPETQLDDVVLCVADPYTMPSDALFDALGEAIALGGFAGLGAPGAARLFTRGGIRHQGAVGVVLRGVPLQAAVSQGARPVGPDLVVTAADRNAVLELAGQPALERVTALLSSLPLEQRQSAARGLMVGLVVDENRPSHEAGDFLVRGLLGADEDTGAIVIADLPRVGQMLRFHVRDAASASEDLHATLALAAAAAPPAGALLFACNGRGTPMFGRPNHDAEAVREELGKIPVAGMFCQGEIGPIAGRSFVHAYTATVAVFA